MQKQPSRFYDCLVEVCKFTTLEALSLTNLKLVETAISKMASAQEHEKDSSTVTSSAREEFFEILPTQGLLYYSTSSPLVLCKPKIMPLKSLTLEKMEEIQRKAQETLRAQDAEEQILQEQKRFVEEQERKELEEKLKKEEAGSTEGIESEHTSEEEANDEQDPEDTTQQHNGSYSPMQTEEGSADECGEVDTRTYQLDIPN